ncbi:MAG: hypothetical protein ABWX83_10835 [Luteibacter sp.]
MTSPSVTYLARVVFALVATVVASKAEACKPIFYQPTGFPVGYNNPDGKETLPANARGALYVDIREGIPHPPSPDDFTLGDLTTGHHLPAQVLPLQGSGQAGSYLVTPQGGFVAGHVYRFATVAAPGAEPGSTYMPVIEVTVGPRLSTADLVADAGVTTRKGPSGTDTVDIVSVRLSGASAAYKDRVRTSITAPRKGWPEEAMTACGPAPDLVLTTPSGCHAVTGELRFVELTDEAMRVGGLTCMGWFSVPF